jgi:DNA polymerase-3 subunit delta'
MQTIGHEQQKKILNTALKSGNVPHALIFSGLPKIGKKAVALEFVRNIFCTNKTLTNESCGNCYACRSINENVFPDLAIVQPEEAGKEIKIEQVNELTEKLSLKSYNNSYKVGIIDDAHLMNVHAQNALLKTLEEPKGKTVLILITAHPQMLLSTIRSRVQNLKFYAIAKEKIESYLIGLGASVNSAKEIREASSGQIGKAIDFYNNPDKLKVLKQSLEEIESMCTADYSDRFNYAKRVAEDSETTEDLLRVMEIWERFFRREMLFKIFGSNAHLPQYDANKMFQIVKNLENVKYLVSATNVNKKLALENFLLNL